MKNQVFRDPAVRGINGHPPEDSFRVAFNDKLCSPNFNSKGAAAAYLQMLELGQRKPEFCSFYDKAQ